MPFNPQWCQTSVILPGSYQTPPGGAIRAYYMEVWRYDAPIDPMTWDKDQFTLDFDSWFSAWLQNIVADPQVSYSPAFQWFINTPLGLITELNGFSTTPWTVAATLPLSKTLVIRRQSSNPSKSGRGMKWFGAVPEQFVDGDLLNSAGLASISASLGLAYVGGFASQGVNFIQQVVSWKDGVGYDVTNFTITQRLGCSHRRARYPRHSGTPNSPWELPP